MVYPILIVKKRAKKRAGRRPSHGDSSVAWRFLMGEIHGFDLVANDYHGYRFGGGARATPW